MTSSQVIREGESYTLAEFKKRLGIGDFAFKTYRRSGLRIVTPPGTKKPYILGSDWLAFLRRSAESEVA